MKNNLNSIESIICDTCCYAEVKGGEYFYCNRCRDWLERNNLGRDYECDNYKDNRVNRDVKYAY